MAKNSFKLALRLAVIVACWASQEGRAQSFVNLYGTVDLGVRYSTNQTLSGSNLVELTPGASATSKLGITGREDLGKGTAAIFTLESALNPDTGELEDASVLFSKQSWVGIEGPFGQVTVGRQYTPLYNAEWAIEPFGLVNPYESSFIYGNYGGGTNWDNSLMYSATAGGFTGVLMTALGEKAGDTQAGRSWGASLAYADELLTFNTAYQRAHNDQRFVASEAWNIGGSVYLKPIRLFLGYLHHQSELTSQKNEVYHTGFIYDIEPNLELIGGYYHDKQRAVEGKKQTVSAMLTYRFSERTAVYVQTDYSKIDAGYSLNIFDSMKFPAGQNSDGEISTFAPSRTSFMMGIRHNF